MIFEEPEFNESEERSLEIFNNICGNLRGDYSHDCIGLMKIWEVTLYIFSNEFNETLLKKLLSTLMKRRPHWKNELDRFEKTYDKLLYYFYKCCKSVEALAHGKYSGFSLSSFQGNTRSRNNFCLIHHNQKTRRDMQVCNNCYTKLQRLELTNYALDYGLLYVLKMRKERNHQIEFCINHPKKLALGNGLCTTCNVKLGNLEIELQKSEIFTKINK